VGGSAFYVDIVVSDARDWLEIAEGGCSENLKKSPFSLSTHKLMDCDFFLFNSKIFQALGVNRLLSVILFNLPP
jgi:hypothetical protein